jgi:cation diffusion facilitator CzcD-associated flavoprotein CzcO
MAADFDAIVIGAGISGFYQTSLRELGLKVRVFETGTSFGGPWSWHRYPGARFDSESYSYGHRRLSRGVVDCQHRGLFQKFRRS